MLPRETQKLGRQLASSACAQERVAFVIARSRGAGTSPLTVNPRATGIDKRARVALDAPAWQSDADGAVRKNPQDVAPCAPVTNENDGIAD